MDKKFYIPQVEHHLDVLGGFEYRHVGRVYTYDDRSYELLEEIFELLKRIQYTIEDRIWCLWFKAERGPIEAWSSFEEQQEWNDIETYEEYVHYWESTYPENENWYYFQALSESNGYKAIFLQHKHVIQQDPTDVGKSFPYDISGFVEWIRDSILECIRMLEEGTYNDYVNTNLPPRYKTGTIVRKDFWDIFPEYREAHYEEISKKEIDDFLGFISDQPVDAKNINGRLPTMTANDFYRFCSLGYKANDYKYCDLPFKEQYYKHADGRDSGLSEINPDSPEEFYHWLVERETDGGHPHEVCRGGNSTHISLYPYFNNNGYMLILDGASIARSNETVKFYNALRRENIPVFLRKGPLLAARLREEEKIGIVPEGVFPRYCSSYFPDEDIIAFMNFPYEKEEETAAKCIWQPIEEVELVGDKDA